MKKDLLLEIGVEEIPAGYIAPALAQFSESIKAKFAKERVSYKELSFYATPKRFVLFAANVENYTEDEIVEIQGPSKDSSFTPEHKPTPQAVGFAKKHNVKIEELVVKTTPKGDYLFAVRKKEGEEIEKILPALFTEVITGLKFPKTMKWELTGFRFARPIRWLLSLYGRKPVRFSVADVKSSNFTMLGPTTLFKKLKVLSAERYFSLMQNNSVMLDSTVRKETIKKIIAQLEKRTGNKVKSDDALIDGVVNLIEYPTLIYGSFDEEFLKLPAILIETTLSYHTRLFTVFDKSGKITNNFCGIRNGISVNSDEVKQGYERVVRARLSDARYFYEKDIKIKLTDRKEELYSVTYIQGYGTLMDKQERIKKIVNALSNIFGLAEQFKKDLFEASDIFKADLVTETVKEFPELQGKIGREIALSQGLSENAANAVGSQYEINGFEDVLPENIVSILISLADRADSLLCIFSAGFVPTGDQDPYGTRRIANGLLRFIYEKDVKIQVSRLIDLAFKENFHKKEVLLEIKRYLRTRLASYLTFQKYPGQLAESVLDADWDDLDDLRKRVELLNGNLQKPDFLELVGIFKRINNILRQAKADFVQLASRPFIEDAVEKPIEKELLSYLTNEIEPLLINRKYEEFLSKTRDLNLKVIDFFNSVKILDENPDRKNNRLKILYHIHRLCSQVANFNKIISG